MLQGYVGTRVRGGAVVFCIVVENKYCMLSWTVTLLRVLKHYTVHECSVCV